MTDCRRPNTISILDASESVFTVETCAAVTARFAPGVERERHMNPFLNWSAVPATLRLYSLRDVVLDPYHMVLLKGGQVIAETNYLQSDTAIAALRVRPDDLKRSATGRPAAVCFDRWHTNYYHWMAHTIPTLHVLQQRHPVRVSILSYRAWGLGS